MDNMRGIIASLTWCPVVLTVVLFSGCVVHPKPITKEEKSALVEVDRIALFAKQTPITQPVTVHEAMARAIKYNLDHRLRLMEEALSQKQLDLSNMSMLPALGYTGSHKDRNNLTSSVGTGALAASTSSDRFGISSDLAISWNILDFGVSYFQAKQDADRVLIANERRRKVVHNLMRDVRFAFWRAASAQNLESRIGPMLLETRGALKMARQAEREGLPNPTEALQYQRMLIEILRQLKTVQASLIQARTELASLINIAPGARFHLDTGNVDFNQIPQLGISVEDMEQMALMNLPELWEENYQARISVVETKKAIARLLPGLSINGAWNYDSNSFLANQTWLSYSSALTWNLMNIFTGRSHIQLAETQETIATTRRLSLSMAALSQVHIALHNYRSMVDQMALVKNLDRVDRRLHDGVLNRQQTNLVGTLERIRSAVRTLTTSLQRDQIYAQLQNAVGMIYVTLGLDPLPKTVESHDVATLSKAIATTIKQWEEGNLQLHDTTIDNPVEIDPSRPVSEEHAGAVEKPETAGKTGSLGSSVVLKRSLIFEWVLAQHIDIKGN